MALSIPSVPVLLVSGPLLFTLTLANAAESPTHAGRFQIVSGEVILSVNDNDQREARVNDTLKSGVRVTTGDNSAALLAFPDGQIIWLQSNTSFLVTEYRFIQTHKKRSNIVFSLFEGGLRAFSGLIAKRNKAAFSLRTPMAVLGVRGTDFAVVLTKGASTDTKDSLYATVYSGAIPVKTYVATAFVAAGHTAVVRSWFERPTLMPPEGRPAGVFVELDTIPARRAGDSSPSPQTGPAAGTDKTQRPARPGRLQRPERPERPERLSKSPLPDLPYHLAGAGTHIVVYFP